MIRHISGTIINIEENDLVIKTSQGIGYCVHVNNQVDFSIDQQISMWTHLVVRENSLDLYGFLDYEDLNMFEILLTIPKVGPKSASQILSRADTSLLRNTVMEKDSAKLSKLSGIGKKTAEKIIAGLSEHYEKNASSWQKKQSTDNNTGTSELQNDTIETLVALGYPFSEARNVVRELPNDIKSVNEAVKTALKQMGNK